MPEPTPDTLDEPVTGAPSATPGTGDARPRYRTQPVSFVRRSGRLAPRQQRAWDAYRDRYVVDVPRDVARTSVDPDHVLDVAAIFGRDARLVVEIGSGQGEAVVAAAEREPGTDFLAVEVYAPGLAQTVLRASQRDLTNVRLVQANAAEVLATTLPAGSVDELWVFFPDPWHKSRHHKRRLVTPSFAALAERVLRAPGRATTSVPAGRCGSPPTGPSTRTRCSRSWTPRRGCATRTVRERRAALRGPGAHRVRAQGRGRGAGDHGPGVRARLTLGTASRPAARGPCGQQ